MKSVEYLATNNNSVWQMLYQRVNGGHPTPEQKKRAAHLGWKRLFRVTFKYPFSTSTSSTEVVRKSSKNTSGVAETSSRSATQPEKKIYPLAKFRAKKEGDKSNPRPKYLSNKLQEMASLKKHPDVEVLYASPTIADLGKLLKEPASLNTAKDGLTAMDHVGLRTNDPAHSAKQDLVVSRAEKKLLEMVENRRLKEEVARETSGTPLREGHNTSRHNTVDSRTDRDKRTNIPSEGVKPNLLEMVENRRLKEEVARKTSGTPLREGHNTSRHNTVNSTTDRDKQTNIPSEGVKPNLLEAKSKKTRTARKESKSTVLEDGDSVGELNSSRKSSKIITPTTGDKQPNTSRKCDTPKLTSLTGRGKTTSEKSTAPKNMLVPAAVMSEAIRDLNTAASNSKKPSKVNKPLDKKNPSSSRKEGKPTVYTDQGKSTGGNHGTGTPSNTPHSNSTNKAVTKSGKESVSNKQAKK